MRFLSHFGEFLRILKKNKNIPYFFAKKTKKLLPILEKYGRIMVKRRYLSTILKVITLQLNSISTEDAFFRL